MQNKFILYQTENHRNNFLHEALWAAGSENRRVNLFVLEMSR